MKTDLVVAGYLIHDGKLLLIHHRKLDKWIPPGGHIDENETPDHALAREFREELNLDIRLLTTDAIPEEGNMKARLAVPFHVNVHSVGDHDHCCFFYVCAPKNPEEIKINKDELNDFGWFSEEELEQEHVPRDVRNIGKKAFEIYGKVSSR